MRRGTGDSTSTRTSSRTRVSGNRGARQVSSPSCAHLSCPTPLGHSVETSPCERCTGAGPLHSEGVFPRSGVAQTDSWAVQAPSTTRASEWGLLRDENLSRTGGLSDQPFGERSHETVSVVRRIAKDCPRCRRQVLLEVLRLDPGRSGKAGQQKKRLVRAALTQPVGFCVCWVPKNARGGATRLSATRGEPSAKSRERRSTRGASESVAVSPQQSLSEGDSDSAEARRVPRQQATRTVPRTAGRSERPVGPAGIDRERGQGKSRCGERTDHEGKATDAGLWVQAMMLMDM